MLSASMLALLFVAAPVAAQDPAQGWLAYGRVRPAIKGQRLTKASARWVNLKNPRDSSSFYSPWFGSDPDDNLNLLQPVNPWFGSAPWNFYNEYFQWSPEHNQNSAQYNVNPGDEHYGSITYDAKSNSYIVFQNTSSNGVGVTMPIKIQQGPNGVPKNYSIVYFVFEKTAPCGDYPPDEVVTFYDIKIEYDYAPAVGATWDTGVVDEVCEFKANIVSPSSTKGVVNITWSTTAADPPAELIAASQATKRLSGRVPLKARA